MSPVFAHGQLRLYLLALLTDGPRHGYEVIQDLEDRFHGLYSPSAGTIYPRLAKLEEEGLVERTDEGRKATYRITAAGRDEVLERAEEIAALQADLDLSVTHLADQVRTTVRRQTADLRSELRAAARQARSSARPATGSWEGSRPGDGAASRLGHGAVWTDPASGWIALEQAMTELRSSARRQWRRRELTAAQVEEIVAILTEAGTRIGAVLDKRSGAHRG